MQQKEDKSMNSFSVNSESDECGRTEVMPNFNDHLNIPPIPSDIEMAHPSNIFSTLDSVTQVKPSTVSIIPSSNLSGCSESVLSHVCGMPVVSEVERVSSNELRMSEIELQLAHDQLELEEDELKLRRKQLELRQRLMKPSSPTVSSADAHDVDPSRTACHFYGPLESRGSVLSNSTPLDAGLPKLDVQSFSGSPKDYFAFLNEFDNLIANRLSDDSQKLSYLWSLCRGSARDAIAYCRLLPKDVGYMEARRTLNDHFGRPHQVMQSWSSELFSGSPIDSSDADSLRKFVNLMKTYSATLVGMGLTERLNDASNLMRLVERMSKPMRERWAEVAESFCVVGREPNFDDLVHFVQKRLSVLTGQYGHLVMRPSQSTTVNPKSGFSNKHCNASFSNAKQLSFCQLCQDMHDIVECKKFIDMTVEERKNVAQKYGRCFRCLRKNHIAKTCRLPVRCSVLDCGGHHHTLMHSNRSMERMSLSSCAVTSSPDKVFLGFIGVRLIGPEGTVETNAFIDNGSDCTLVDENVATQIGLKGQECFLSVRTLHGTKGVRCRKTPIQVQSLDTNATVAAENAYIVRDLPINKAQNLPRIRWKHLDGIEFHRACTDKVGLLIGGDISEAHWILEQRVGSKTEPYATLTPFGWILRGPCAEVGTIRSVNYTHTIEDDIRCMFEADFIESSDYRKGQSVEDREALQLVEGRVSREDSHYVIPLPWRNIDTCFPSNLPLALSRLTNLKRRLLKDPNLQAEYSMIIKEYEAKGYISEMKSETKTLNRWFIPHHPVFNPHKIGKVRIVFDCAAQFKGISLNNMLLQGPDLTNNLLGVLLRFRRYRVAVTADIQEMFLQVKLPLNDRNKLSFLWWKEGDLSSKPSTYQLNVHPFGATSSPFCATYALRRMIIDHGNDYLPLVTEAVARQSYVDDFMLSFDSEDDAKLVSEELRILLQSAGFRLTKFVSNSTIALQGIPLSERITPTPQMTVDVDPDVSEKQRALGVKWLVNKDVFVFEPMFFVDTPTRRSILKCVSSLYDPLGIVAPMLLPAKRLLQQLCFEKLGWDAQLDTDDTVAWHAWLSQIVSIRSIVLPRTLLPDSHAVTQIELHVFCDASEKGYGAVAYLRYYNGKSYHCSFVCGKSRVSPLKVVTIPRLELVAAVLAARLSSFLKDELELPLDSVIYWTDSMVVLRYLRNTTSRFAVFVANRIRTIHEISSVNAWRYVPSQSNPADTASRGSIDAHSESMSLWLEGPEFLKKDESAWPSEPDNRPTNDDVLEVRKVSAIQSTSAVTTLTLLVNRYSSWTSLLRALVWLKRFTEYCLVLKFGKNDRVVTVGPINTAELNEASNKLIRMAQNDAYGDEITALGTNRGSIRHGSSLARLRPFLKNGLLRMNGRSRNRDLIILPPGNRVTNLIIQHHHCVDGHMGASHVLAKIRQTFWVVKGMAAVKKVINACVRCKRLYPKRCEQIMAPLPEFRVSEGGYPFEYSGVDYFGPFLVQIGRSKVKRYGCLFTCMRTRAVHIEVAHSLSTDSFIMALLRFISRRGSPSALFSDNGSNFTGAEQELKKHILRLDLHAISRSMTSRGIDWHFNPPNCSHRGGAWERIIRSVRRILAAVSMQQTLSEECLLTYIVEVERILNDRPLVPVYDDPSNIEALRPNDLILLRANPGIINDEISISERYSKRWRQAQHLASVFWKRWRKEYLPLLHSTHKWLGISRDLTVGDIVIVINKTEPRGSWPLGKVIQVFPGPDNHVRQVVVRTAGGTQRCDIRSLSLLEAVDCPVAMHNQT